MVKNPHILEALEKEERQQEKTADEKRNWYKKADELYNKAISLNPQVQHSKSEKHLEMLIEVRQKMKLLES